MNDNSYILRKKNNNSKNRSKFYNFYIYSRSLFRSLFKVLDPDDFIPLVCDFITVVIIFFDFFLIPLSLSF